jgi:hypothetical protein
MDRQHQIGASLRDITMRLDRIQADVSRLAQQRVPDRFVPLAEATRHLHCGRDWLVAQIKGGVLRPGVDFLDRTSGASTRKRYLVNPVSALRWLNGSQPVQVRVKSIPTSSLASLDSVSDHPSE